MLFYDSSCFQLSFIYHNHHGQKAIKYYIPNFYQIQDMFESWYKVDKKGSFFHEDKLLFYQKQLEKFLQTRVEGHGRSGCGRGGDPDLRETGTGMWSCLSALFEEILCTVSDYNPVEYLLFWPRFWWGCPNEVAVSFRYSNKNIIFATIQHNYAGRWKQNKMESVPSRR